MPTIRRIEKTKNNIKKKKTVEIESRIKRITIMYLTVFLAAILLISLYINMSSFRNQFITNELSFYSISGSRVVDNIENGLLYGKSLDHFYGMDRLIKEWSWKNKEVAGVRVLSADRQEVWYQQDRETPMHGAGTAGHESGRESDTAASGEPGGGSSTFDGGSAYIDDSIYLEIRDSEGSLRGYLNIAVDLKEKLERLHKSRAAFLAGAAVLLLAGILSIIAFCWKSSFISDVYHIEKKKVLRFMLLLLLLLQAAFTVYSSVTLRDFYIEISNDTGKEIQALAQNDIDKVIGMGVTYDQIYDFESYAEDVTEKAPMIESITLEGGQLKVTVSGEYIENAVNKMLLDMVTVLIISMFVAAEIVNYMMITINNRLEKALGMASRDRMLSIRASSFLIHVACYLPVSFIPILMYRFTGENASDFILGLPVMVLFAAGFLFIILAGNWSVRYGWRKLLLAGTILVAASSLLAGLFANAAVLVIARGIYGAAYSMVYIAIREFAAAGGDRRERSEGLAQVTAGLYAGINIGAVLGAIIYESVGFRGVFAISAAIGFFAVFAVKSHCVLPQASAGDAGSIDRPDAEAEQKAVSVPASGETNGKEILSVFKDRDLVRLALFIIAPLAITALFFEYFLPVYAVKEEIGSADIGRAFLINGIAVAYVAPQVVKHLAYRLNEKVSVLLFTLLMAAGFVIFGFTGGLAGILIASAVMGIAEGTALVSQNMIMLDLDAARRVGTSRMLSIYATVRKLAQAVGPQIFAAFMLIGYESGMMLFGGVIAACSVLYILSGRRKTH